MSLPAGREGVATRANGVTGVPDAATDLDTRFRTAVQRLDRAGRLIKVQQPVRRELELTSIMKRLDGDRALLFEDIIDHDVPVIGNLLSSQANCETAFNMDVHALRACMQRAIQQPILPVSVVSGPCQEVVVAPPLDLERLMPVLVHAPGDSGKFITAGIVIARDPLTGVRNASYHRLQLVGPERLAIKLDVGRHLRAAFEHAQERGEPLPIAVCVGPDLSVAYAAAFMGSQMPPDADELAAAGGIRNAPLSLVACKTQPLEVPAETELVMEGTISPTETVHEGPFGEFVGYHSDAGPAPVFHVSCVTHRRNPVYHAINGAGRETIVLRKYVMEASVLRALTAAVPIVQDVEITAGGLHRFHLVVQVHKCRPGDEGLQRNAILVAFATLKDLNQVIVVDEDIDLRDPVDVEYALATRMEASRDLILIPGARGHEYVRVSDHGIATKLGIDATVPFLESERFRRVAFADPPFALDETSAEPGSSRLDWLAR